MRSRAARLTVGAAAWLAIGGAAAFVSYSERKLAADRRAVRAFDVRAREAADALADLRAAEQAYVAAGQGIAYWVPKVAATQDSIARTLAALQSSSVSGSTRASLGETAATLTEFAAVDKRARDYVKSGQVLMAGDVIFTEGGQAAAL